MRTNSMSMLFRISDKEFKEIVESSSTLSDIIRKIGYANGDAGKRAKDRIRERISNLGLKFNSEMTFSGINKLELNKISDEDILKTLIESKSLRETYKKLGYSSFPNKNARRRIIKIKKDSNIFYRRDLEKQNKKIININGKEEVIRKNGNYKFTTKIKGSISETAIELKILKKGFLVSRPTTENSPYDLIADINNNLVKIQVKTATYHETYVSAILCGSYHRNSDNKYIQKIYSTECVDYFALYCIETNEAFFIKNTGEIFSKIIRRNFNSKGKLINPFSINKFIKENS